MQALATAECSVVQLEKARPIEDVIDAVRIDLRRALRLRRWAAAIAAVRPLQTVSVSYEDARYVVLTAAEEALTGRDRADVLLEWLLLHIIPDRANVMNAARRETAASLVALFPDRGAVIMHRERHEPPIKAEMHPPAEYEVRTASIRAGTLTDQVDQAEAALICGEFGLYQRSGEIVRAGYVDAGGGRERLHVSAVDETHLAELMGRAVAWWKHDARAKQDVPTRCPPDVARAYLARGPREWRLPELVGVVDAPTLRADGTLLKWPGYDDATGLLHDSRSEEFPNIPDRPTEWDASEAADVLLELLAEFPFLEDADQAVAMAAILTAVVRRALPAAPLFAFTAPAPGTGKSCLVDVIHMISTGRPASAMTWTGDPAEDRKQIDAALLEGASAISFDNVTGPLRGDRLNQILTQPRASVRVLGQSRNVEVACQALITANGNNLAVAADMTRRTMLCRLDAGVERPELREFRGDPLAMIRADRGRYLAAALTILRAYHVAGRSAQPRPLGSFDAWSSWVRGAVIWAGFADPAETMDAVRANDPARTDQVAVFSQWDQTFGDSRVSSADIIARTSVIPEFREALLAVAGSSGAINTRRLGAWLREVKGRLVGTMKVEPAGMRTGGVNLWVLQGGRLGSRCDVLPMVRPATLVDMVDLVDISPTLRG